MKHPFLLLLFLPFLSTAKSASILEKGALPDGKTLNTQAINETIQAVFESGGGYVYVPAGTFKTGTVVLRSGVYLHLEPGAVLFGSENLADYTRYPGHRFDSYRYHLITAIGAENCGILGQGRIDGNGTAFWEPFRESDMPFWIKAKDPRVSRLVEFSECRDIKIEGVEIVNSPEWTVHLFNCRDVQIRGIRIQNHLYGPNADGIDLTGCHRVSISDCHIETCDDGICLKTNADSDSSSQIAVTNCIIRTSCAALKIGNESARDIRQVSFSNCIVYGSSRIVSLNSEEGGWVEDIQISQITGDNNAPLILTRPIHLSVLKPKTGKPGGIRNVSIQDFVCRTQGRILLTAESGTVLENIQLRNIRLVYPWIEDPYPLSDSARSAQYSPANREARKQRAAVVAENVRNLVVNHLAVDWPDGPVPADWQQAKRIENGSNPRTLRPDYRKNKETDFAVFWGRNLNQGYIWAPYAKSSDGKPGILLHNSTGFTIR